MSRLIALLLVIQIIAVNNRHRSPVVSPLKSIEVSDSLSGISGLILWEGRLWAHNDREDGILYSLDPADGSILEHFTLEATVRARHDWEDISQDGDYIYIGDMGNNARGNRRDLHILRISKEGIRVGELSVDTISYSYSDQVNFGRLLPNTTKYDCEAFFVTRDSIYLFTKQWTGGKTSVYSLPKSPGYHTAQLQSTHYVGGMITGASLHEDSRKVVLCGYTMMMQPFLLVLSDFRGTDFFNGSTRKIRLDLPFHQVEGITTENGTRYYISNERSYLPKVHNPQKIHLVDLSMYLN